MELNNNDAFEQTYECYLINGKLYVNYKCKEFNDVQFENDDVNLIRFGYDNSENNCDNYLIDINTKTRQASLKNYPKLTITIDTKLYDKNNLIFYSYPFHGKNTTILNKNGIFVENKNIYPKYFMADKNKKYVVNTLINILFEHKQLTDMIKAEIYAIVFHLRMEFIEKNIAEINDFIDNENKIELINYELGESIFHNGYYGKAKHTIKLYNESEDKEYNINEEQNIDEDINTDINSNDASDILIESVDRNEFLPDIMKLNINLTNKILELENKLHSYKSEMNNENNNIKYKINNNFGQLQYHSFLLMIYFIFFIAIAFGFTLLHINKCEIL
jgi:hypothetical protein